MIRTQVYLPDELFRDLKLIAASRDERFSDLIREGAQHVIEKRRRKKRKQWGKGFIGIGKGGPKNLASRIDYYLYGAGSKWGK